MKYFIAPVLLGCSLMVMEANAMVTDDEDSADSTTASTPPVTERRVRFAATARALDANDLPEVSINGVAAIRAGLDPMDILIMESIESLREYIQLRDDTENPLHSRISHRSLGGFNLNALELIEIGFLKGSQETFEKLYRAAQYSRVDRLESDEEIDLDEAESARVKYMREGIEGKSFAATVTRGNLMTAMKFACELMERNVLAPKTQAKIVRHKKARSYLQQISRLENRMKGILAFYTELNKFR